MPYTKSSNRQNRVMVWIQGRVRMGLEEGLNRHVKRWGNMGGRTYQSGMQFSKWYNDTSHTEYCPARNVAGRCPKRDGIESTLPTPLGFTQGLDWHSRAEYYSGTPDLREALAASSSVSWLCSQSPAHRLRGQHHAESTRKPAGHSSPRRPRGPAADRTQEPQARQRAFHPGQGLRRPRPRLTFRWNHRPEPT